jgi:hypothetical protein
MSGEAFYRGAAARIPETTERARKACPVSRENAVVYTVRTS